MSELDDFLIVESVQEPAIRIAHYPVIIPGEFPGLLIDSETGLLWFELDEDFRPELLALDIEPGIDHPVFWEMRNGEGASSLLRWGNYGDLGQDEECALFHGLTYRQPFLAEVSVQWFKGGSWECPEWDCEIECRIAHISKLPEETILERWIEWIRRAPVNYLL